MNHSINKIIFTFTALLLAVSAAGAQWPTNYTTAYSKLSDLLIGAYLWPHPAISDMFASGSSSSLALGNPGTLAYATQVLCVCTAQPTPDGVFVEVSGYGFRPTGRTFILNVTGAYWFSDQPQNLANPDLSKAKVQLYLAGTGVLIGPSLDTIKTGQVTSFVYTGQGALKSGLSVTNTWQISGQTITVGRGIIAPRTCALGANCTNLCSYSSQYSKWLKKSCSNKFKLRH